jgi:hypothetical protein
MVDDENAAEPTAEPDDFPPARQLGDRFTSADVPLQQLEEIEQAQQQVRDQGKPEAIESIEKSKQRVKNWLRSIRRASDLEEQ